MFNNLYPSLLKQFVETFKIFFLGSCLMVSSFILMSLTSTSAYFCIIKILNLAQSVGVGYNLLNHSLVVPFKFSFIILKSLSAFRSHTSTAMVSLYAESLTSSWSHPQNSSSIPCGLVISYYATLIKDCNIFYYTKVFRPLSTRHSPHPYLLLFFKYTIGNYLTFATKASQ
jgi:hypothetical protein